MKTRAIKWSCAATLVVLGCGCNLILGLEPRDLIGTTGGTGGTGGAGGATVTSSSSTGVSCSDGVENGAETDKDCGGSSCSPCKNGLGCKVGPDCESLFCNGGTCLAPACDDKTKNGKETDADCGGPDCVQCGPDKKCSVNEDCISASCSSGICMSTCTDGAKGGKETDADCGGSDCPACADSKTCKVGTDCKSGVCQLSGCVGASSWDKALGGGGANDSTNAVAVAVGTQGDAALFGSLLGQADVGGGTITSAGSEDAFITKIGPGGNVLWSKRYCDAQSQVPGGVAIDNLGSTYVTGSFQGAIDLGGGALMSAGGHDVFVAKLDSGGDSVWRKKFGDAAEQFGVGVATDNLGNAYITGILQGTANFGGNPLTSKGQADIFLAKLGPGGAHSWSTSFGDASGQYAAGIAVDTAGNVVITGYFAGSLDFGGVTTMLMSAGGLDTFVARFDTAGVPLWSTRFGGPKDDLPAGIAVDAAGNVILTGSFSGSVDFGKGPLVSAGKEDVFVVKLDPAGTTQWTKNFGGAGKDQFAAGITTDSASNISVAFYFNGDINLGGATLFSMGANDVGVVKLNPLGGHVWSNRFGDVQNQVTVGIAAYDTKNLLLGGNFTGIVDFGGGQLVNSGGQDAFLVKLLTP